MTSSKVIIKTSDDQSVTVDHAIAMKMVTLKDIIEAINADSDDDEEEDAAITIPKIDVDKTNLDRIVTYLKYHQDNLVSQFPEGSEEANKLDNIDHWDKDFAEQLDFSQLISLIGAANYLNIKSLLDLGCKTIANSIKGKSVEVMRTQFNVANDFTPEEYAIAQKENSWCSEPPRR